MKFSLATLKQEFKKRNKGIDFTILFIPVYPENHHLTHKSA